MERIDNYKIVEKIGEGGMGEVYKGIDTMLEREVAIKMLRPELSSREDIVERFRSEAIALGRLNHSHIATVYNFGRVDEQYYMAMEFVPGETLDSIIQQHGRLPWRDAVQYAIQALEGLAHAHQSNVIHRDIKPANIIVNGQNTLKLLDFGIARILQTARLTRTKHSIGTPGYMSPEQHQSKEVDARSDIYAVGIVLYEMLTGQMPFQHDTEYGLVKTVIEDKPKSLRSIDKSIPAPLEKLVLKALQKKPEKRFADAQEFIVALRDCLAIQDIKPKRKPEIRKVLPNKFINFCQDYPVVVVVGVLLIAGSGVAVRQWVDFPGSPSLLTQQKNATSLAALLNTSIDALPATIPQDQLTLLQNAADKGDARAQSYLGRMYFNGTGIKQDYATALAMFEKAASQGDATGQNGLGAAYARGRGVDKNEATALTWYRKAAAQGHARAQNNLGDVFENGLGVDKNLPEAIDWYLKSANQGFTAAQNHLGQLYADGVMVPKDEAKAFEWYQKAADQDYASAQFHLGYMYLKGIGVAQDKSKAFEWTQKAADKGSASAQFNLGVLYRYGNGVAKDLTKADEWYEKAANQGHAEAQATVGAIYLYGEGVPKNTAKAVEWLQKAADQNSTMAQSILGFTYLLAQEGIKADYAKAFALSESAAKQGDSLGQFCLGWIYRRGLGKPRDDKKAFQYFNQAAQQNYTDAELELAFMYVLGEGVKRDYGTALTLFQRRAEGGSEKAQLMLGEMYLGGAAAPKNKAKAIEWFQKAAAQGSVAAKKKLMELQGVAVVAQDQETPLTKSSSLPVNQAAPIKTVKKTKKAYLDNSDNVNLAPPPERYDRYIPRNR
ncbi:MAG: serine/threonine-protein kinase [Methylococcaceae bacterium]|nr:serine/threonine-protein kinase [Methylococcaceae bacterium]MDP3904233.1 serine/threonine-protein kinase [Methylococcaceae bacterium]